MDWIRVIERSFLAGIVIGIGAWGSLSVDNRAVGAFIFSMGLLVIMHYRLFLFTGQAASYKLKDYKTAITVLLSNFAGAATIGLLYRLTVSDPTMIFANKAAHPLWYTAIMGFLCGMLIYMATQHKITNPIYTILPVMVFILIGAEHCVANMFYLVTGQYAKGAIIFFIVNVFSNWLGSVMFKILKGEKKQ
jgi:formate/nitrite transporter FocA (FNT family)